MHSTGTTEMTYRKLKKGNICSSISVCLSHTHFYTRTHTHARTHTFRWEEAFLWTKKLSAMKKTCWCDHQSTVQWNSNWQTHTHTQTKHTHTYTHTSSHTTHAHIHTYTQPHTPHTHLHTRKHTQNTHTHTHCYCLINIIQNSLEQHLTLHHFLHAIPDSSYTIDCLKLCILFTAVHTNEAEVKEEIGIVNKQFVLYGIKCV